MSAFRSLTFGAHFKRKRPDPSPEKSPILPSSLSTKQPTSSSKVHPIASVPVLPNKPAKPQTKLDVETNAVECSRKDKRKSAPVSDDESLEETLEEEDDDLDDVKSNTSNSDEDSDESDEVSREEEADEEEDDDQPAKIQIYTQSAPTEGVGSKKNSIKKRKGKKDADKLAQIHREEVNHFRNVRNIHVYGDDIPDPIESFSDLASRYNVSPTLLENIAKVGYSQPTPIQMQAIPILLESRDLLASAPTGSGKTAAFLIPMIQSLSRHKKIGYRAVVVSPTRELAKQTFFEVERLTENMGLRCHMIESTSKVLKKFRTTPNAALKHDILVTTPNRLVTLLQADPPVLSLEHVRWLVIDESDKLFEADKEGGFRDQLAVIYKACSNPGVRRALFSATFAFEVEEWCKMNLDNVAMCTIGARNAATSTIDQRLVFVGSQSGKLMTLKRILHEEFTPPVLIFVQTKQRAMELYKELKEEEDSSRWHVDVIHSGREQSERDFVVNSFRAGKVWTLIATEVMGRGIDFIGVNLVINYDFPKTSISYIHRIGRTGRAGRRGKAVTFFAEKDAPFLRSIANVMQRSGCEVPSYMLQLKKPSKSPLKKRKATAKMTPKDPKTGKRPTRRTKIGFVSKKKRTKQPK